MNNIHPHINRLRHSPFPRFTIALVVALAWRNVAFGGEIHDAACRLHQKLW